MIKNITIKNFKLFKDSVTISFANHGSQLHGADYILNDNISSIAGVLGKNASGKSSILEAIKNYAFFSNPQLSKDLLAEEYISYILKDLNEKLVSREEGQEILDEAWNDIEAGIFPDYIKGEKALKNHFKTFDQKAFDVNKNIIFIFSYAENKKEIIHELEIGREYISEKIILGEVLISSQREKILKFNSNILKLLNENSIKTTALIEINPDDNLGDIERLKFKDVKEQEALLNFVKICDENVERLIFGKNNNLVQFVENRTLKVLGLKNLSLGTRKIIGTFKLLYKAITSRKTFLMIDEIENSLHLSIIKFIITLFKKDYNKMNSQLLFTTHNPLIFEEDFKRNSIYFMQDKTIIQNTMRFDKKITPGFLKGELISNPKHNYRFDFLMDILENE
ncbi:MAG: ATP-binding protein [Mycoplasmatales bacterium]|nr:ATP-binding protein [Mycoplasmatales bacterium]